MSHQSFSLKAVLVAVAMVGVSTVAFVSANVLWSFLFQMWLLLALCVSVVSSFFRDAERRAFWIGFAVFGWSLFLLLHSSPLTYFRPTSEVMAHIAAPFGVSNASFSSSQSDIAESILVFCFATIGAATTRAIYRADINAARK